MPQICRLNDKTSGHEGFPPTTIIKGSPNFFVNGLPVARQGDPVMIHCKPGKGCHPGTLLADNDHNFYANGLKVQCVGDHVSCQPKLHTTVTGSGDTNSG